MTEDLFRLPVVDGSRLCAAIAEQPGSQRKMPGRLWNIAWRQPLQGGTGRIEGWTVATEASSRHDAVGVDQGCAALRVERPALAPPLLDLGGALETVAREGLSVSRRD